MMPNIEQNTEHCGVKYWKLTYLGQLSGVIFIYDGFSHKFLHRLGRVLPFANASVRPIDACRNWY